MTRMLASVRTLQEAEIVLAGGADIVDLCNPTSEFARAAVAAADGRRQVSTCIDHPAANPDLVRELAAIGADYIRIHDVPGSAPDLASLASPAKLIAILFADRVPDLPLLHRLARAGFAGAMIDVRNGSLLDRIDIARLSGFVADCHAAGLIAALAGSLEPPDIPRLLVLAPDLLAFDGALRSAGAIDMERVRTVRRLIPPANPVADANDVDYRLLAARGHSPDAGEAVPVDLVFVEDLVLPVFIGAYARERDAPQNVRFAVTASVMRTGRIAEDMRDVFSYDLITDGIRMLIGSGHVTFVETLAERISAMVLDHPRVTKVVVRVQKLDTGSGVVGVEIERTRPAARTASRPVVPLLAGATKAATKV